MKKKKARNLKPKNDIFVTVSKNSKLTEASRSKRPIEISNIKTYSIKENIKTKKFEIYELSRRKKPIRVKTIPKKKGITLNSIKADASSGKILFKSKYVSKFKTQTGKASIIQTNYLANFRSKKGHFSLYPQLVGLCVVQDIIRNITDNLLGYSSRMSRQKPSKRSIEIAEQEIISMAIGKFISLHGSARKSGEIVATIVSKRYQYWRSIY